MTCLDPARARPPARPSLARNSLARACPWGAAVAAVALLAAVGGFNGAGPRAQTPADPGDAETRNSAEPSRAALRARLFDALQAASTEAEGRAVENLIWRFWFDAPSPAASDLLQAAIERREAYDFAAAETALDRLVALEPDYAEGWNQRAFIRFLREDFEGSLSDIRQTLAREPKHFGALSGRAQIFFRQGRTLLAHQALREAVEIHPWLRDRLLLPPEDQGGAPNRGPAGAPDAPPAVGI